MPIADKDIHKGHRARMRSKLETYGPRIFDTYELLEMLLYYVIPYKDTNPIAKRLLEAFGSLDGVLSADPEALAAVDGIGVRCADFLVRVGEIIDEDRSMSFGCRVDVFDDYSFAGAYLADYLYHSEASICMALLDNGMRLIDIKDIPGNDFASGAVKARYFIDAALSGGASVVIIAHKHEHGALFPTEGDMATDKLVRAELARLGIAVAEHYIVGGSRYVGLKLGLSIRVSDSMCGLERFYESIPVMAGSTEIKLNDAPLCHDRAFCYSEGNPFEQLMSVALGDKSADACASLLKRYGNLSAILSEDVDKICSVGRIGMNAALFIKLIGYIHSRRVTDEFKLGRSYGSSEIQELVKALYVGLSKETVYMLSFDAKDRLIGCDFMGEGTVSASDLYPRRLLEIAVKLKAVSVSLAHNHPLGTVDPSKDDIVAMRLLNDLFRETGMKLSAHYIVADDAISAFSVG